MDFEKIKRHANDILEAQSAECSYIEYKKSCDQLPKILKTICAFGNNYYDNDVQFVYLGIEEQNNEKNKAIPVIPILGIDEGNLEKCRNILNSLRSYIYPNVSFEILTNEFAGRKYLLVVVPRQTGGPFMVSEKSEKDKSLRLKPGRYIRIEAESRLARVDEEYDLLRKFSNFHFSSLVNNEATIDDLNMEYLAEYVRKTSVRKVMDGLIKSEMAEALNLSDKNDPLRKRIKNCAILMFSERPDKYIPYSYTEMIIDMFGTKRKMESKHFTGPIWKQYHNIVNYINDNFLNVCTVREDGRAESRKLANFPFVAVEELVANAIVHNNYENAKPIQIYISEDQINIVNYNKPLPPLKISDLNERSIFNERDTENPEIRDMFKQLGIIESFGTGIGEAKRALEDNGSPKLYYKTFSESDNVTSVVIPVNDEYKAIKTGMNPKKKLGIEAETQVLKNLILNSGFTEKTKRNLLDIYIHLHENIFGNADIMDILGCSQTTATEYINKLRDGLEIISAVSGHGKGKYRFLQVAVPSGDTVEVLKPQRGKSGPADNC